VPLQPVDCFHFCDNRADADECARLVVAGIKRATATSVAELALAGQRLPEPGDLSVVTNWNGEALAIICTETVTLRRFDDVDADFARLEGEGDGSLAWWRAAHTAYYQRVLAGQGVAVDGDLMIACETFRRVF